MAQTQRPGDGEDENGHETPPVPPAGAETAETAVLPATAGPATPSRGVAAPLGTVGDGRYRLTSRLGRGGMAEVFAAQDVRLARTVAVKLLRPELSQDEVARLRFTREAHSVASLNHHSIVAVYDTGEQVEHGESTPFIVMELVEGRTVRELLVDEEAPPVDQALIIIAGVLEALAYSHRHGIVHRDIKPANVIITTGGAVKVMDFGIARALTGEASTMTQTGMVMGTPQYLSPEQALGKAVDHRSDLYAAGCMLYELLALRPPFTGDTPLSVVYQHVQDAPVPPSEANHRVPPQLDGLVLRALAKNPDERYQSADEFRAHLQHALREMHGAAGAGYAEGAAAAAAAAAGLAAAGSGNSGHYPGFHDTPNGSAALTEPLGPVGGSEQTAVMPFPASSPYRTPSEPYSAVGGGADDGSGDGPSGGGRRRGPWPWVIGVLLVLAAAGAGIGVALSGDNDKGTPTAPVTATSPTATAEEPTSQPSTPATKSTTKGSTTVPNQPTTHGPTSTPSPTPSSTPSPSPSKSPSGSASSSASSSASGSASPKASGSASATSSSNPPPGTSPTPSSGGGGASPGASGAASNGN
ncbi:protein kinase [Kitasatospora sp. NPDC051853]|uniref:protein kinase domain-containing protein n=1 Tax=Kitasatospora sp. NPDC051853 TaxID=3364058 RepID=UPI0037A58D48